MSQTGNTIKRAGFAILAALALAGATACDDQLGGGGEEPTPASTASPAPGGGESASGGGEADPSAAPPAQPGGVLASRELQDGGAKLQLDITGLQRQAQTVILTWRITVLSGDDDGNWFVADTMGSGNLDYTVSGVVLIDPVNAQRYLVARSGGEDGPCACSDNTNFWMDEGDSVEFHATYAAPPADVTALNVEFPRFGAFTNVPLS
ncbi:MAG TPA: hypothetical protein VIL37_06980 [Natronosporangium sp.]